MCSLTAHSWNGAGENWRPFHLAGSLSTELISHSKRSIGGSNTHHPRANDVVASCYSKACVTGTTIVWTSAVHNARHDEIYHINVQALIGWLSPVVDGVFWRMPGGRWHLFVYYLAIVFNHIRLAKAVPNQCKTGQITHMRQILLSVHHIVPCRTDWKSNIASSVTQLELVLFQHVLSCIWVKRRHNCEYNR